MKRYLLILFILLSCSLLANQERESITAMGKIYQCYAENGSCSIWPGFQLHGQPALFHFSNGHAYAIGIKNPLPAWEKRIIGSVPFQYCAVPPISLPNFQPTFPLRDLTHTDEKGTVFVFSLEGRQDFPALPLLTFIHERFHFHQFQCFKKQRVAEPCGGDYETLDQLALIELENQLLTRYLQSVDHNAKRQLLKEYLAVNQNRRREMHAASLIWETHQQQMEGLADYVSLKTFQVFPCLPSFSAPQALLTMRKKKTAGITSQLQDCLKGRHYFVGAVLAMALDECQVADWKIRIEREGVSLQKLLEEALPIDTAEKTDLLSHAKELCDWNGIRSKEGEIMQREALMKETLLAEYAKQKGIIVKMGLPTGHKSAQGKYEKSCRIDHRQQLLVNDSYHALSQDQAWKLSYNKMPFVMESQKGERHFKIDPQAQIQLDGQTLTFEELLKNKSNPLAFKSAAFHHTNCDFVSRRPGKIIVDDDSISFRID